MSNTNQQIKEFKDWFFSKAIGRDQNFSKLQKGTTDAFRMFKNGNIPDEEIFTKLLASVIFGIEEDDRAKDTGSNTQADSAGVEKVVGGHVTVATDEEAIARNNGNEGLYTRVPRTSQLTEVDEVSTTSSLNVEGNVYQGIVVDVERDQSTTTHSKYDVGIDQSFISYLQTVFNSISEKLRVVGTIDDYWGDENTITGRWLICDGKTIGESGSGADYEGEQYRDLYVHLGRVDGLTIEVANDRFDSGIRRSLPDLRGIFIRGVGSKTINGQTYTGVLGQYSNDQNKEHSHAFGVPYAYEASLTGIAFPLNPATFGGDGATPRILFGDPADTTDNSGITEVAPANVALNRIISY